MPDIGEPTLDQLRVLAAIADAGSFSAAARRLRRAQSVISYSVANLELQLGVQLFDRAGRAPTLTEAGRALVADARRVGLLVDEMRARAGALQHGTEAEIALAVDVMFPIPILVNVLRDFSQAFPTVGLRLRMEAIGGVAQLVLQGACCLGVSGWVGQMPHELQGRVISHLELIPVAAPTHPLAGLNRVSSAMARDHIQLVLSDSSHMTDGQDFGVIALRSWRLGDLGAKHALLKAGLGWGNMPAHLVEDDLRENRLVRLAIEEGPSFHYPISIVRRSNQPLGPAAEWLAQALEIAARNGAGTPGG
jgi:DNA-binding transcriptional LysR family regulator